MSDYGHEQTDKELKRIENLITKEYSQAAKELEEKMLKQFEDFNAKDIKMRAKLTAGEITQTEYNNWLYGQVATGDRWRSLRDSMVNTLVNTDKAAATIIQGNSIKAYGDNMNYGTYEIEHDSKINTGFTLYDENTVKNLLKEDPKIIPMPKVDIPKDELWNRQHLTSAVTQGILQGESIPKIADRLQNVAFMGRNSAIRNARTYTTAAENKGRIDSYERAEKLGIQTNKKWIATLDDRTRAEHRHLDGMSVSPDEDFKVDGYTISFPGDPSAEPEMFYNCRCTLVADIVGYPYNDERKDDKLGDMDYEEWKHAKDKESKEETKEEPAAVANTPAESGNRVVVEGTDLSNTWERRDEFEFAIEDIIDAQGFEGLPKLVSQEEFDKAVAESNFIAQRTYSAPDKQTLNEYQDMLYNGKWYVDCSVGGAQYGQGMYCAADYNGNLDAGVKLEMETYRNGTIGRFYREMDDEDRKKIIDLRNRMQEIDEELYGDPPKVFMANYPDLVEKELGIEVPRNQIETLTLDPSAKIITYDDILEMQANDSEKFKDLDIGVYAAMKGYDAINAEGHGESGSYTVILNRTKVLILDEKIS